MLHSKRRPDYASAGSRRSFSSPAASNWKFVLACRECTRLTGWKHVRRYGGIAKGPKLSAINLVLLKLCTGLFLWFTLTWNLPYHTSRAWILYNKVLSILCWDGIREASIKPVYKLRPLFCKAQWGHLTLESVGRIDTPTVLHERHTVPVYLQIVSLTH